MYIVLYCFLQGIFVGSGVPAISFDFPCIDPPLEVKSVPDHVGVIDVVANSCLVAIVISWCRLLFELSVAASGRH